MVLFYGVGIEGFHCIQRCVYRGVFISGCCHKCPLTMHLLTKLLLLASRASKGGDTRKASKTLGNQIIRKGYLGIAVSLIKGNTRDYWFVLTSESITWYKDDEVGTGINQMFQFHSIFSESIPQEKEQKYVLKLDDMRVKDVESSRFAIGKKHAFALFYTTGRLTLYAALVRTLED